MIHHLYANRSSSGDWLSAKGIQALLAPLPVEEHLCDEPFVQATLRALEGVSEHDVVVIGGGGLFMDYFRPLWEGFARIAPNLRYCIWGVGVVDLKAEASLLDPGLLRPIVQGARVAVMRDDLTRQQLGLPNLPAAVLCPSVVAVENEPVEEPGVLHSASLEAVGGRAYEEMVEIGMQFADLTGRVYRETNNRFDDGARGLAKNLDLYRRSDLILSSRLHGCIIGLAMGRPVVAVSGDRKVEAFMASVGLEEWVVDASQTEALPGLLHRAQAQLLPANAILEARAANSRIAAKVRQLAAINSGSAT